MFILCSSKLVRPTLQMWILKRKEISVSKLFCAVAVKTDDENVQSKTKLKWRKIVSQFISSAFYWRCSLSNAKKHTFLSIPASLLMWPHCTVDGRHHSRHSTVLPIPFRQCSCSMRTAVCPLCGVQSLTNTNSFALACTSLVSRVVMRTLVRRFDDFFLQSIGHIEHAFIVCNATAIAERVDTHTFKMTSLVDARRTRERAHFDRAIARYGWRRHTIFLPVEPLNAVKHTVAANGPFSWVWHLDGETSKFRALILLFQFPLSFIYLAQSPTARVQVPLSLIRFYFYFIELCERERARIHKRFALVICFSCLNAQFNEIQISVAFHSISRRVLCFRITAHSE